MVDSSSKKDPATSDTQAGATAPQQAKTPTAATDSGSADVQQNAQADVGQVARIDETIPGGKYMVDGRLVNGEGQPINEDGSKVKANEGQ